MVEFTPCTDLNEVKALCAEAGKAFVLGTHAYTAQENGVRVGFGLFLLEPQRVCILHIPPDDYLADVLVRSAMGFAQTRGATLVNFAQAPHPALLRSLGFTADGAPADTEIKNFLHSCKNCAKEPGKSC